MMIFRFVSGLCLALCTATVVRAVVLHQLEDDQVLPPDTITTPLPATQPPTTARTVTQRTPPPISGEPRPESTSGTGGKSKTTSPSTGTPGSSVGKDESSGKVGSRADNGGSAGTTGSSGDAVDERETTGTSKAEATGDSSDAAEDADVNSDEGRDDDVDTNDEDGEDNDSVDSKSSGSESESGSGCVSHTWLTNRGYSAEDLVHSSPLVKRVSCPDDATLALPCGTEHHAVFVRGRMMSYGELCSEISCKSSVERVNSLWAFHADSKAGIQVESGSEAQLFMHDVRYSQILQVYLHLAMSATRTMRYQVWALVGTLKN